MGRPRVNPFQRFFNTEAAGGLLLLVCAAAALAAANSPSAAAYERIWQIPIAIGTGSHSLSLTLHQWINDGLMALFFLLVGLEIKRELLAGELASLGQAILPISGAIGGMVVPALLYVAIAAAAGADLHGWGIPMATDIAFALGTLSLVAPAAPTGLKVFLTALAIVDDLGAVVVIALFYTQTIAWGALTIAAAVLAALFGLTALGVRRLAPYLVLGAGLWFFVHESGVHATIAGVLLALAIPTRSRIDAGYFSEKARQLLDDFDRAETGDRVVLTSKGQQKAIHDLEAAFEEVTAPLLRLESALHGLSAFVVMPLFALSNAGVALAAGSAGGGAVILAVVAGLAIGKPLGITAVAWATAKLKLTELPAGMTWPQLHGGAWLGGIGFTMSLFIATLAFEGTPLLAAAKLGTIAGSLVAGAIAAAILRLTE